MWNGLLCGAVHSLWHGCSHLKWLTCQEECMMVIRRLKAMHCICWEHHAQCRHYSEC